MAKLDESNMISSIEHLGQQIDHAWKDIQSINFSPTAEIRNVVVAGMGGSGLGADVIKHLFKDQLTVPFEVVHDYTLPGYINQHTLVLLSSYSGTTEEVLACAKQAEKHTTQIMVICAGGDLSRLAEEKGYPIYKIDPKYNPSQQPRMAIGYAIFGTIGLMSKAGVLSVTDAEVGETIATVSNMVEVCKPEVSDEKNPAKMLAFSMFDKRPVLVVSDFLEGVAHTAANQHNENAKMFVDYKVLPEINHHLMEGLRFPNSNAHNHIFVFVQSKLYHQKNQLRLSLTQNIVEDNEIETLKLDLEAQSQLAQAFEMMSLFGFTSFYISMLEGINPSPIPFVDKFKAELKKT